MEIADVLSGSLTIWLSPKKRSRSKSVKTFGASTVDQTPRMAIYCHPWRVIVLLGDRLGAAVASRRWWAGNKDTKKDQSQQNNFHSRPEPYSEKYSGRYYIGSILTLICERLILTGDANWSFTPIVPGATLPKSSSTLCRKKKSDLPRIPHIPER
jgi:nitroreductase